MNQNKKTYLLHTLTICLFACTSLLFYKADAQTTIGSHDWAKRGGAVNHGNGASDLIIDMATDKHGNIYVLAQDNGKVNIDGHIATQDSAGWSLSSWDCDGTFRWMKIMEGTAFPIYLATDTSEGVYISGSFSNVTLADTVKFDTDTFFTGIGESIYTAKYNSAGILQWFKTPASNVINASTLGLSALPDGSFYWFTYLPAGVYDNGAISLSANSYCVLQYDGNGNFQSHTVLNMSSTSTPSSGSYNMQFARHETSGRFYLTGTYSYFDFGNLTIGNSALSGSYTTSFYFAAAFSATGSNLWVKQGDANTSSGLTASTIDKDGNLYISGGGIVGAVINGDTLVNDSNFNATNIPYIAAMDSAGNKLWINMGKTDGSFSFGDIKYNNGNIFLAGAYSNTLQWDSLLFQTPSQISMSFVSKFSAATGKAKAIDSIGNYTALNTIAPDINGNVYVGGYFINQVSFGAVTLTKMDTALTTSDWFVAKYKNVICNCNLLQPEFSVTASGVGSYGFTYNGQTPYTSIQWDFGDGTTTSSNAAPSHTYTTSGNYAVCVTVVNGCGTNTICHWVKVDIPSAANTISKTNELFIYPNPANDILFFEHVNAGVTVDVYNLYGQRIVSEIIKANSYKMNISNWQTGAYLLRFTDSNGQQTSATILKQ